MLSHSPPENEMLKSEETLAGTFMVLIPDSFSQHCEYPCISLSKLENTMHDDALEAGLGWSWRICKLLIQEVSTEVVLLSLSIHNTQ